MVDKPEDLFTVKEAAERLGISRATVLRLVADRKLEPAHKIEGITGPYLFTAAQLDAFTENARIR